MNMFQATNEILTAFTSAFVLTAQTVEKTVKLIENEVNNLDEEQQIRLDKVKAERLKLQQERTKQLESVA